jgi:hypothetical protein
MFFSDFDGFQKVGVSIANPVFVAKGAAKGCSAAPQGPCLVGKNKPMEHDDEQGI